MQGDRVLIGQGSRGKGQEIEMQKKRNHQKRDNLMTAGHDVFEQDAHLWWSENSHCALLHSMILARLDFLKQTFPQETGTTLKGATVLDVGCGGGLFAEEVARLGCRVTGVDLSPRSIEIAKQHAEQTGLGISYDIAEADRLPFPDSSFDLVYCVDVLEHVNDVSRVVAESARVLRTGGMYFFDTINRTWLSKFFVITLLQKWEWVRVMPPDIHDWKKFIKPAELGAMMASCGLEPREMIGLLPDMDPISGIKRLLSMRKVKLGKMSYVELGQGMVFRPSAIRAMNYMGYGIKKDG